MSKPLLEMRDIEKHFGSVIALGGVSFDLYPGEVHCLLGDNGAGKSTFIKTMSGVHQPTSGEMFMDGEQVSFTRVVRLLLSAGLRLVCVKVFRLRFLLEFS